MVTLLTYQQPDCQRPYWEMSGPQLNTETSEDEIDGKKDRIPPLRDLAVVIHQLGVNVRLFPQRTPEVDPNRLPEV